MERKKKQARVRNGVARVFIFFKFRCSFERYWFTHFLKMSKRVKITHHDPEAHSRHLKRQLESLEKDNHQSLNDIEGLISIALSAQEDEGESLVTRFTMIITQH